MARPLRIEFEGAWYHVMNRGAGRRWIFKTDEHRRYFLSLLGETHDRFNAEWHGYCLMGNHYHLLLRTPEGNLQRIMRHINGLYTQYFNRDQNQDGALFRGRYQAILVDADSHWLQLSRYIHRNPLEAKIIKRLDQYCWSSYRAYVGLDKPPPWLTCHYLLKALGNRHRYARYKAYVAEGIDDEMRSFYGKNKLAPILGDKSYKQTHIPAATDIDIPDLKSSRVLPDVEQIVRAVCQHLQVTPEEIWHSKRGRGVDSPARGMAMSLCQQVADMKLGEIAKLFRLKNYTSAGSGIRQFKKRLENDPRLQKIHKLIKLDLTR